MTCGLDVAFVWRLMSGCCGKIGQFVAEIEVDASTALCIGLREIGVVTLNLVESHVPGFVANDGIGVTRSIGEEFDNSDGGTIGCVDLGSGNCSQVDEHGCIYSNSNDVVQKGSDDLLDVGHLGLGAEMHAGVETGRVLDLGTVGGLV
jgi:hypothetical protein